MNSCECGGLARNSHSVIDVVGLSEENKTMPSRITRKNTWNEKENINWIKSWERELQSGVYTISTCVSLSVTQHCLIDLLQLLYTQHLLLKHNHTINIKLSHNSLFLESRQIHAAPKYYDVIIVVVIMTDHQYQDSWDLLMTLQIRMLPSFQVYS
jgi:hypothetical protein